jgi:thiol-disulfide isomerase/thioredoxin
MTSVKGNKSAMMVRLVVIFIMSLSFMYCTDKANSEDAKTVSQTTQADKTTNSPDDSKYPQAPDFALEDLEGNVIRLSDFEGKVVFLNFWATWCPPCRAEIPYFIEMVDQYGEDGFVVLGVDLDPRDFSKVPAFVEKQGINYTVVYDTKGVSNLYGGIQSIPTTFVINRNGKVVQQIVGSRPKLEFERILKSWL